jgi:hypothetical protein
MPTNLLCHLTRHSGTVHIAYSSTPEIMEDALHWHTNFGTRSLPGFVKGLDGMSTAVLYITTALQRPVEYKWSIFTSQRGSSGDHCAQFSFEYQYPPIFIFRDGRR